MAVNQIFSKELEAAKAAAARLAELRELERTAARLPELESQADLQQRQQEATVSLDEAERRARETLENAKPVVQAARVRFEAGLSECLAALKDLQPTQAEIEQAAARLWSAVGANANLASANGDDGGFWGKPFGVSTATVNAAFGRHWGQVGGMSKDLDFLPDNPDRVALAILRATQTRAYSTGPNGGASLFFKHR